MDDLLLLHILTGEATLEEKEKFYTYLEKNEEEKELFLRVKKLWFLASMKKMTVNPDKEFERLWHKITKEKQKTSISIGRRILRYAAILIFVFGVGGFAGYYFSERGTKKVAEDNAVGTLKYIATRGISIVEFPDGTKVWLNSESELTFREDKKNKRRLAELTGEAYFEVAHCDDCPFMIKAGDLIVHDLGTTFNIKAYPEDNYIETSLVEGDVDILTNAGEPIINLDPGESAMYLSDEKRIELRSISSNVLSAWRDGKFVIRDQRLEDIFKELGRWYGIDFQFENNKYKDYRFTGNIKKTTTALHVLKVLKAATDFNYRIIEKVDSPDTVIIY